VRPNSPAARSGLQPGDLIVQLNRKETASLDAFEKAIAARRDRHAHLLRFRRGGQDQLAYLEPVILDR
jgi:S1-C subfamily serine protease